MPAEHHGVVLTWTEIEGRANRFVNEWTGETRERAEKDTFWNDFFQVFGLSRRRVAVFENLAQRQSTGNRGWMDVFYPGYLAAEHKSAGENLDAAMGQALDYLPSVSDAELPRQVVVCDFANFVVYDLETKTTVKFTLQEFPNHVHLFSDLAGYNRRDRNENQEDVNLKAVELLTEVHDYLKAAGYGEHDLRDFMVRVLFVLFADDTTVWERGLFHDLLLLRTREDGSDVGPLLIHLFQTLSQPKDKRPKNLDPLLNDFTHIGGPLFKDSVPIPATDSKIRQALLKACVFDWSKISPAIFGSMFQNVMTPTERRSLGAHYTTDQNIMKLIRPLFLDELEAELGRCTTPRELHAFQDKLARLRFFDPGAGCGNFLVVSYRELRRLELEALRKIREYNAKLEKPGRRGIGVSTDIAFDATDFAKVNVSQFYAIELEEFPAKIASVAMYLVDHLANRDLSAEFGTYYARFPIEESPSIFQGNALKVDWNDVLPAAECAYLLGNPPFRGRQHRSPEQSLEMELVVGKGSKNLDYVAAWFVKAGRYMASTTRAAFVATNSITQGEQPALLWGHPAMKDVAIQFAHRTFSWRSEARGRAHVHVVIVGLTRAPVTGKRRLFDYADPKGDPVESAVTNINGYLVDAPNVLIRSPRTMITPGLPAPVYGSMANDGGGLIITPGQYDEAMADPIAAKYVRPYMGAEEMLNGKQRWCLWLLDADPRDVAASPFIQQRLQRVREYRSGKTRRATLLAADTPGLFTEIRPVDTEFMLVPFVSSERRAHLPLRFYGADVVPAAPHWVVPGADLAVFGVMSSMLYTTWLKTTVGALESRFRVSPGPAYQAFPFPEFTEKTRDGVEVAAREVLDVVDRYPDVPLTTLYHPNSMPADLVTAFRALDRAVLRAYKAPQATTFRAQQRLLFRKYVRLTTGDQLAFDDD